MRDWRAGLHPDLVSRVERVLAAMQGHGWPMIVTDGLRTAAQQMALYAQGRSRPGRIVTRCDGITTKSRHQAQADGFGHAADCTFVVDGALWYEGVPWDVYGREVRAVGLVWGGDWSAFPDRPHVELPKQAPPIE